MMIGINLQPVRIDKIRIKSHTIDVLRLDLIHPVISGNKWYKLKGYVEEAKYLGKKTLVSFGGAYSNHIVATAAAARSYNMNSVGIIRGERALNLSHTLVASESYGMKLFFESREAYKLKKIPAELYALYNKEDVFMINEGGYGITGAKGASDILKQIDNSSYTHILAAVGTGTMLAGLVMESRPYQSITGISVMKNNMALQHEINQLLPSSRQNDFHLTHDYHFGGYAKYNEELIAFMNEWYRVSFIPTDFVYTGKLFYALNRMIQNNHFNDDARILVVHSGGLQGNLSLPKGKLIF